MFLTLKEVNIREVLKILLIGFFVVIGTFPENDWTFSVGIDPPMSWVFNYLYSNDLSIGKHILFPHGPLAFFMYPLQENILIATLITSLLKILLVINVSYLLQTKKNYKWIIIFFIAYLISIIAGFYHLILTNIILLFCNYFIYKKYIFKILAFILTAFAFYVKANVAIMSGLLCFTFFLYYMFFEYKSYKSIICDIFTIISSVILFWLLMYGTFSGLVRYFIGIFNLAQDNSAAASWYPYNNWWILSAFLIISFSIPFINKTKKSLFYGILISLSLFAAWKHGMSREDFSHVRGYLFYVIISLLIFIMFNRKNIFKNTVLSIIAILLLSINMKNSVNYTPLKYELIRINNFVDFVTKYSEIKTKAKIKINENISSNKLPLSIKNSLNKKTVDIYPWDYSIIPANNLNWQPRPVIHAYASYTNWLDKQNAEHFNSKNAPQFIIWELINSCFYSIDNRYAFNDEPLTIIQLISNYYYYYSNNKFAIFKKRLNPIKSKSNSIKKSTLNWGEWANVPQHKNSLVRVKLNFDKSILQAIKTFFYKDEQFWVYLKLDNGIIIKHRIVPKNAKWAAVLPDNLGIFFL